MKIELNKQLDKEVYPAFYKAVVKDIKLIWAEQSDAKKFIKISLDYLHKKESA